MTTLAFLDHLSVLSDSLRCRALSVLEAQELTVGELCSVLQLPQSTVSRHLKQLDDAGWTTVRRDGNRRFYRLRLEESTPSVRELWSLVRAQLDGGAAVQEDHERLQAVLSERRTRAETFFSASAAQWDRLRVDLFGDRSDLFGLLGLLDPEWVVGDLGCGTGLISDCLSPFVSRIVAVDSSVEMLSAARDRLAGRTNVTVRQGDLEDLPIPPGSLDAAVLFLTLQYTADPWRILAQARRALKTRGVLLVVDLEAHEDEELRQRLGHQWQGFSESVFRLQVTAAGYDFVRWVTVPLPVNSPSGPRLFTASARAA